MSQLRQLQWEFLLCLAKLINKVEELGYTAAGGELKRSDEQAEINAMGEDNRKKLAGLAVEHGFPQFAEALLNNGKANGIRLTEHGNKLALDLDLFINGEYQGTSEAHRPLGEYWKTLHPLARWGGDFQPRPDGNHYSFEYNGVK